ncbi:MAG TPA: hypothetical protein PLE30_10910 [Candidatus Kapabacteria bacterium]|nr:hypothetical protein [Candidatus Kapabacteria bacterium]
MYSAVFADDSHLRSLGGHGSGGGGGGRSLGSTQGFGPKTYDPYKLLSPNGNGVNVKSQANYARDIFGVIDFSQQVEKSNSTYSDFYNNPDKYNESENWISNTLTALYLTLNWFIGNNEDIIFESDRVANAMRNARKVNDARDYFYNKYKGTNDLEGASVMDYNGSWGLLGPFIAGFDPIEQFIGSCSINIYLHDDVLQFNIINRTSLTSASYHIWPNSWNWSQGPMGNYDQVFIFTEPINFKRLKK